MPRAKGIPSYSLHRASGQARVVINGKSVYLGVHGSPESKAEYERVVRKTLADRAKEDLKRRVTIVTDLTIAELVAKYLAFAVGYYVKNGEPTSEYGNICLALRPVMAKHGAELAWDFGPLKLKSIRQSWVESGIVRAQINKRVDRVRAAFAWGVSEELINESVLAALATIKALAKGRSEAREGKKILPVADELVDAIRPFVSRQVWGMIELKRCTGARPGEICCMRAIDIEVSQPTWTYRPSSHKTQHHDIDRVIYLGPKAQDVLRPWLRPELEAYLFSPAEATAEHREAKRTRRKSRVQPSQVDRSIASPKRPPRERYTSLAYARAISRACRKAQVSHWHPNQLRHSTATRLRKEAGLETARVVLGHSDASMTTTYAQRDLEAARSAMERFG